MADYKTRISKAMEEMRKALAKNDLREIIIQAEKIIYLTQSEKHAQLSREAQAQVEKFDRGLV